MNVVVCPHCHSHLHPTELEDAATGNGRYLVCPECDAPLPLPERGEKVPDPVQDEGLDA